jgi:hypothetical protein
MLSGLPRCLLFDPSSLTFACAPTSIIAHTKRRNLTHGAHITIGTSISLSFSNKNKNNYNECLIKDITPKSTIEVVLPSYNPQTSRKHVVKKASYN